MNLHTKLNIITISTLLFIGACGDVASSGSGTAAGMSSLSGALKKSEGSQLLQNAEREMKVKNFLQSVAEKHLLARKQVGPRFSSITNWCTEVINPIKDTLVIDQATCTATCSAGSASGFTLTAACTGVNKTITCGNKGYALKDFDITTAIVVSGLTGEEDLENVAMAFDMTMKGSAKGEGVDGVVDCKLGFTASQESEADFDCSNSTFTCKIGGTALSCEELTANKGSSNCE